jgi:cyclopropane-fatty-acyl-phospholipid synthase
MTESMKKEVQKILDLADIKINGTRDWDIQVHNEDLYKRVLAGGSLALGEGYMDGWWDCAHLDQFFAKILSAKLDFKILSAGLITNLIKAKLLNVQNKSGSKKVAQEHYDIGNEFYSAMLDANMQYTCAYYKDTTDLDEAQEKKLHLICTKAGITKGDRVLELGCGWGGFAKFAAEHYGCHVTGYNISQEQVTFAKERCKDLPVKIVLADYRDAKGTYDKVVSIGLCEHVGYKNYAVLMKTAHTCLKDGGIFFLHTIGKDKSVTVTDPWIHKYIFPNGMLPSIHQLSGATEGLFVTEDFHNFGAYYDLTLMAWYANFVANWDTFSSQYGERFFRMWSYYLLACAGAFRSRRIQLWQFVFSKGGIPGGYESVR